MVHASHNIDYHIIIIGGGVAGLTLASLLAHTPLRVAVIETHNFSHSFNVNQYDARVSAINRASENIFRHLKVWDNIKQMRIADYQKMQISDDDTHKTIQFDCADIGESNLGHIIENQVMLAALINHVREHGRNITLLPHFEITDIQILEDHGYLQDTKGRKLKFQLVVGADGKDSWLRKKMDIPLTHSDYQQTALIAHIKTEKPHNKTAYQRFLPLGPLAFLPLNDPHCCSIVWSTSSEQAQHLHSMQQTDFDHALTSALDQLGKVETITPRYLFPLHYQHAEHYFQKRAAFIGDAAHTIHPMAGLGLNLGLLDAACLAENILRSHAEHRDLGLEKTLKRYEIQQKSYNTITLQTINFLQNFFCSNTAPFQFVKNVGMSFIEKTPLAKNFLARYALGTLGDLPACAESLIKQTT